MDGRMRWTDIVKYFYKKLKGELHPRISLSVFFEVEPALYSTAPYYDTLEDAEKEAEHEDEFDKKYLDEDGFPKKWKEDMKVE